MHTKMRYFHVQVGSFYCYGVYNGNVLKAIKRIMLMIKFEYNIKYYIIKFRIVSIF